MTVHCNSDVWVRFLDVLDSGGRVVVERGDCTVGLDQVEVVGRASRNRLIATDSGDLEREEAGSCRARVDENDRLLGVGRTGP